MKQNSHRDSIALQDSEILAHHTHGGGQYILRVHAPACARLARPGSFAHICCGPRLPMRRPLSIMRTSAEQGWVEFLYKVVGTGTATLAARKKGEMISVLGPIGKPFQPHRARPRTLLIGGGVGIPPMIFLAETLCRNGGPWQPLVLMGSEIPFPFQPRPSAIMVPGMPEGTIATMPLLEDWGVPGRLASLQGYPGCYDGYITDLALHWIESLTGDQRDGVEIFACGPTAMLEATAQFAGKYGLPCQVALEEFMACGVGGCAGCTVRVETSAGTAMKRVCVDGPVFDAYQIFSN